MTIRWLMIYARSGDCVASCSDTAGAAALAAFYGPGTEIRNGHAKKRVVWNEGEEEQPAAESYDFVADVIAERVASSWSKPDEQAQPATA